MSVEPRLHRLGIAVGQEINHLAPLQVHDDGAVALSFAPSPVVDPHETRRWPGIALEFLDSSEQRIGAGCHEHLNGESSPGLAAQSMANRFMGLAKAVSGASVGMSEPQELLGEDASGTLRMRAKEATDRNRESYRPSKAGQVSEATVIAAVNALGVRATERTSGRRSGGLEEDREGVDFEDGMIDAAPGRSGKQFDRQQMRPRE